MSQEYTNLKKIINDLIIEKYNLQKEYDS